MYYIHKQDIPIALDELTPKCMIDFDVNPVLRDCMYRHFKKLPYLIERFVNHDYTIFGEMIDYDSRSIGYMENPSPDLQMMAVEDCPSNIKLIDHLDQTYEVQLCAISTEASLIGYTSYKNSESFVIKAIEINPYVVFQLSNPTDEMYQLANMVHNSSDYNRAIRENFLTALESKRRNAYGRF